jgi:hypothetical protein
MLHETARNGLMMLLCIVAGILAGLTARGFTGGDGVLQPGILAAMAPVAAIGSIVVAVLVAAGTGVLMGRMSNPAVGLFVAGWAFFALAWRMEPLEERLLGGASLSGLAVETVVWAIAVAAAWTVILRAGGGLPDVEETEDGRRPHPVFSVDAGRMIVAAAAAAPAAWLIARTVDPGQVIAAAVAGGIAAGLAGRLAAPHVQPYVLVPATVLVGGITLGWSAARLGPDVAEIARTRGVPPLASIPGAAWAAGSMLGVAMGLGWARSFLHHEDTPAPEAPARRRVVAAPAATATGGPAGSPGATSPDASA